MMPWKALTLLIMTPPCLALEGLSEAEMAAIDGAGVGLILDNYELMIDNNSSWKVGVEGTTAELVFEQFWWAPTDGTPLTPAVNGSCASGTSSYTSVLGVTGCRVESISGRHSVGSPSATLGRVSDPIRFDIENRTKNFDGSGRNTLLNDGSTGGRTTMTLAAPKTTATTDLMDASFLMTLDHGSNVASQYRYDTTRVTTRDMDIDGSYLTLWAEPGEGLSYIGQISIRASSVTFVTNEHPNKPSLLNSSSAGDRFGYESQGSTAYGNFRLGGCLSAAACDGDGSMVGSRGVEFYYPMGRAFYQPVQVKTNANGNLTIELKDSIGRGSTDSYCAAICQDFYRSATPRGHIRIGSLTTNWDGNPASLPNGGTGIETLNRWDVATPPRIDFGYSKIEGIQIHKLKITTKDL